MAKSTDPICECGRPMSEHAPNDVATNREVMVAAESIMGDLAKFREQGAIYTEADVIKSVVAICFGHLHGGIPGMLDKVGEKKLRERAALVKRGFMDYADHVANYCLAKGTGEIKR